MDVWQRAVADLRDSSETAGAVSQVGGKLDCRERLDENGCGATGEGIVPK